LIWRAVANAVLLGVGIVAGMWGAPWSPMTSLPDTITITDTHNMPASARLYLTGNSWSGCFCRFADVQGSIQVDNVTGGPSQIAFFSNRYGLLFDPNVDWDPMPFEKKPFVLPDVRPLPLKVWILHGGSAVQQAADKAVQSLSSLLTNPNKPTGIRLDFRGSSDLSDTSGIRTADCGRILEQLKAHKDFDPNALNVYFTDMFNCGFYCDPAGMTCPDAHAAFVLGDAGVTVTAHEVGHALLGPDHWRGAEINENNVMLGDDSARTHLSIGQIIRMNVDRDSMLNVLSGQAGLDCDRHCPKITLDDDSSSDCLMPKPSPQPPRTLDTEVLYRSWRNCIECNAGELEALVDHASPEVVQRLSTDLTELPAQIQVRGARDVASENDLARQQRRALLALVMLRLRRSQPAAFSAIDTAYANRQQYREDVTAALERAHEFIATER
jgi:hypothetical protein